MTAYKLSDADFDEISELLKSNGKLDRFILKDLYGDKWESKGDGDKRRVYGKDFGSDVENGRFPGVKFIGIRRSGRDAEYSFSPDL